MDLFTEYIITSMVSGFLAGLFFGLLQHRPRKKKFGCLKNAQGSTRCENQCNYCKWHEQ